MQPITQCEKCKHLNSNGHGTCTAFDDGIPDEILWGEYDHRRAYPGDDGIRFEPIENEMATEAR